MGKPAGRLASPPALTVMVCVPSLLVMVVVSPFWLTLALPPVAAAMAASAADSPARLQPVADSVAAAASATKARWRMRIGMSRETGDSGTGEKRPGPRQPASARSMPFSRRPSAWK